MKSRQRIGVTQTQQLRLNMGLRTAIQLLQADAAGLTRYLEEQAADNPHLSLRRSDPTPAEWLPRWSGMIRSEAASIEDTTASAAPSLMAHVMAAIPRLTSSPRERKIAELLAESLEPSGWLGVPLATIANGAVASIGEVEAVLTKLQKIEPAGLFARGLSECLMLQATEAQALDAPMRVILDHLALLARGEVSRLARMAKISEADVLARFRLIRSFDPKPGAQFAALAAPVREPDLVVRRTPSGWQVALNRSSLPDVEIRKDAQPPDAERLTMARAVVRMVSRRNATLLRVGQEVLLRQTRALEAGPGHLAPLTMSAIAQALELHESTISRVVAGTSVDTPQGTWWLKRLFSGAVGTDVSAAALRDRLMQLIAAEDRSNPLSDATLCDVLSQGGAPVARRTVAKYRTMLMIPPAHRRKLRPLPSGRDIKGRVRV